MAEAKAILRHVRVGPRKARVLVDMIRGQQVPQALAMLKYAPRAAAQVVEKVLRSAVANAEQKEMGDKEAALEELQDVLRDGDDALKTEAQELIDLLNAPAGG